MTGSRRLARVLLEWWQIFGGPAFEAELRLPLNFKLKYVKLQLGAPEPRISGAGVLGLALWIHCKMRPAHRAALVLVVAAAAHATDWPQTPTRATRSLDGYWDFAWLGQTLDVDTFSPSGVPTPARMAVPGAWDLSTLPGQQGGVNLNGAHGSVLYRTRVYVTPGSTGRLHFGACGFWCAVWVDGALLATHGGQQYTAFWVGGIPQAATPWRTVEVLVDNRFNSTRAPLLAYDFDWYLYSGLFRSVTWYELPAASLLRADVLVRDAPSGAVDIRLRLHDLTETVWWRPVDVAAIATSGLAPRYRGFGPSSLPKLPTWVNVSFSWDGSTSPDVEETTVAIDAYGTGVVTGLRVPNATLWTPSAPALHTVLIDRESMLHGPFPHCCNRRLSSSVHARSLQLVLRRLARLRRSTTQ